MTTRFTHTEELPFYLNRSCRSLSPFQLIPSPGHTLLPLCCFQHLHHVDQLTENKAHKEAPNISTWYRCDSHVYQMLDASEKHFAETYCSIQRNKNPWENKSDYNKKNANPRSKLLQLTTKAKPNNPKAFKKWLHIELNYFVCFF